MARVRDRLSHHYHRIDPDQLWTMSTVNVPAVAVHLSSIGLWCNDALWRLMARVK
jgi:uncharacterized protein with HEPN domain